MRAVYEVAGVLGIDPAGLTLRELHWMAEGRGQSEWWHTAAIIANVRNLFVSAKGTMTQVIDCHPHKAAIEKRMGKKKDDVSPEQWSADREAYELEMKRLDAKQFVMAAQQAASKHAK